MCSKVIVGNEAGSYFYKRKNPRCFIRIDNKLYLRSRLVYFYHKNKWPEVVDHINRNSLDDRIENLRGTTQQKNIYNQKLIPKRGKYLRGTQKTKSGKFISQISVNYKIIRLGVFKTEKKAHKEYIKAVKQFHKI